MLVDALSEYCYVLSTLSYAINSSQKPNDMNMNMNMNSTKSGLMLHPSLFIPKQKKEESALMDYNIALGNLQACHSKLVDCLQARSDDTATRTTDNVLLLARTLLSQHVELSQRALTTCASSNSKGYGPLHENGLLKNLTGDGEDDFHEVRVVTLAALRASIEKLKRDLETVL